jgi:hypothetical protein
MQMNMKVTQMGKTFLIFIENVIKETQVDLKLFHFLISLEQYFPFKTKMQ